MQKRAPCSCMPRKRHEKTFETLLQTKERLTRELRLRTERRVRELLEPEQLAVIEGELEDSDSKLEVTPTKQARATVSNQDILILIILSEDRSGE